MEKKETSPALKGIIISLILIVLALALQFMGLEKNKSVGYISILLFIGGIIYSCISYAKELDGNVTFGNDFTHGFKTATTVTVLMVIFTVISIKFINPDSMRIALEAARTEMENKNASEDEMEMVISFTQKYFFPLTIGSILLIYLITGVISALIGAAVAKKNPKSPFPEQG